MDPSGPIQKRGLEVFALNMCSDGTLRLNGVPTFLALYSVGVLLGCMYSENIDKKGRFAAPVRGNDVRSHRTHWH
jgi:hypothetical protein